MPCVCLVNTFARWQSFKTSSSLGDKPESVIKPEPIKPADLQGKGLFSDAKPLRIPHPRANSRIPHPRETLRMLPSRMGLPRTTKAANLSNKTDGSAPVVSGRRATVRMTRADLINAESKLGSTIFGPIPAGHRREFFHDKQNIWIWHEDWEDGQHNPHQLTVRYEVRTSGVYKKVSTGKYFRLEGDELENFRKATRAYLYVIKKNLYNREKSNNIA